MFSIAICDDLAADLACLQALCEDFARAHPELPLRVFAFASPYDLLDEADAHGGFDLYLLDILLPHLSGIALAQKIRQRGEAAEILFLTISREYALDTFSVKAAGYLVKPVQPEALERELLVCLQRLSPAQHPALLLKTRAGLRKVRLTELVLVESFNHTRVCTLSDGSVLETPATLASLYGQVKASGAFFMPPRAYIVNLAYVSGFSSSELQLASGKRVPIARGLSAKFKEAYLDYMC